jgi:hypothetical protein
MVQEHYVKGIIPNDKPIVNFSKTKYSIFQAMRPS